MATTKKAEEIKEEKTDDGMVELRVPRAAGNDDPNVFISINGVNYLLPRGKTVKVPSFVAWEYERAQKAQDEYFDTISGLTAQVE